MRLLILLMLVTLQLLTVSAKGISQDSTVYPATIALPNGDTIAAYTLEQERTIYIKFLEGEKCQQDYEMLLTEASAADTIITSLEKKVEVDEQRIRELELQKLLITKQLDNNIQIKNNVLKLNGILEKEKKRFKLQRDIAIGGGITVSVGLSALLIWAIVK